MIFADWLHNSSKTQAEVATDLGVSQAHVSMLASGKKQPSADLITKIQIYTKTVRLEDWYPELAALTPTTPDTQEQEREVVNG